MSGPLSDISHVIQLAIAPVFLLTAIGTVLNVLVGRLSRAVDRRRALAAALAGLAPETADLARTEMDYTERRIHLVYFAISMAVLSALLICCLIAIAFIDAFAAADLAKLVAGLFILAMVALIAGLSTFLREIFLAIHSPRSPVR
jgi:MFS family permease